MISIIVEVMGGVGLFLLGMGLMTEGLKAMAGDAIRGALTRFTRSPLTGVMSGTVSAAILQSSSATIIATVGFVGAGLLTFSQALGIVLGATIGTTFTGWLVVIVGFKLKIGAIASLVILVGAFLRLFGDTRRSGLAYGLAGFGLIFVGIDTLQQGMGALQSVVDFSQLGGEGFAVRVKLVLLGVVFTVITQSSSAGVVAALAAMHSGLISFEQAAALVVGMNIGTTFTSAVATIGGDANVRRTGFSHVLYNMFVSVGAVFLIGPYIAAFQLLWPEQLNKYDELALVGFHTLFNVLGVAAVLPFIKRYAAFIERLFPEAVHDTDKLLDKGLLKYPELALTAVQKVLAEQAQILAQQVLYILGETHSPMSMVEVSRQLGKTQQYIDGIHLEANTSGEWKRLVSSIQFVDYLRRLHDRCQNKAVVLVLREATELHQAKDLLLQIVRPFAENQNIDRQQTKRLKTQLRKLEKDLRQAITQQVAEGKTDMKQGAALMEAARWLQRVSIHLNKIDSFSRKLNYQHETKPNATGEEAVSVQ